MNRLDKQMCKYSTRLRDDLNILPPESNRLASIIADEVSALIPEAKQRVKKASVIPLDARLDELEAFQGFMDRLRLTDNPVRALRNAIAHSNWRYLPDFSGLEFWAKKGAEVDEPPSRFQVTQHELGFWQTLARCVAYASYLSL